MEGEDLIRAWLGAVERARSEEFVPLAGFDLLPPLVRGDSSLWSERFFASGANPHRQARPPRLACHLAGAASPDVLRHEYSVAQMPLEVLETANFALIRVGDARAQTAADVNRIGGAILNAEGDGRHWVWRLAAGSGSEAWFSTDPEADPLSMESWTARADAGIRGGTLMFLCFKKDAQKLGYHSMKGWFGPGFRPTAARR